MSGFDVSIIAGCALLVIGLLVAVLVRRQKQQSSAGSSSAKEALEALIPAIAEIEGGYYEHVWYFISEANKGLERIGSPYRYSSTSKKGRSWHVSGAFVDAIAVVEVQEENPESAKR